MNEFIEKESTIDDLLRELRDVAAWFGRLGMRPKNDRFGSYIGMVERLVHAHHSGDLSGLGGDSSTVFAALYEANELIAICRGLRSEALDEFARKKVARLSKGPELYTKENPDSTAARNLAFELLIASKFAKQGARVQSQSLSDIGLEFEGRQIFVECKRLTSAGNIAKNIGKAFDQLHAAFQKSNRHDSCGVIALEYTKIVNPKFGFLEAASSADAVMLNRLAAEAFVREHVDPWKSPPAAKVLGVVARFSVMAHTRDTDLFTYCDQGVFRAFAPNGSADDLLARSLNDTLWADPFN